MSILHICNTFFDYELSHLSFPSLKNAFDQHEVFLQLQFLPFLFASKEDGVAVSFIPEDSFWQRLKAFNISAPHLHLIEDGKFPLYQSLDVWGHSPTILKWAKKKQLSYQMPPWSIVQRVNSKEFSFQACPLPGGKLIHNEEELQQWLKTIKGEGVLKTCFGAAGAGHLLFKEFDFNKIRAFAEKEWKEKRAIIGEPWVNRILDFSTQWEISKTKEIKGLGMTLCENDFKGRYRRNRVGDSAKLFGPHLEMVKEQQQFVQKILSKIAELGYFGNVGIDAMIYKTENGSLQLHPIVEINARKTMGWAALAIQQKHFPGKDLQLAFTKKEGAGILPSFALRQNGSKVKFSRYLELEIT